MKKIVSLLLLTFLSAQLPASVRESVNNGWRFCKGDASSMEKDFGHGCEYFTYIAKARSTGHNHGPADPAFDDSDWQRVSLPHDWVVDLPFSGEASHSHGYKCVGWKWPENSVGWYRKHLHIGEEDRGKRLWLEFDGIFRNSQVFCNGFYLGGRQDGYLQQVYDISEYIDYGADNVITVRCDASLEEGWYYEGAGIYRNVWLTRAPAEAILPHGVQTCISFEDGRYIIDIDIYTTSSGTASPCPAGLCRNSLLDAEGNTVAEGQGRLELAAAREWSPDDPYLYRLRSVWGCDTVYTRLGLRRAEFDPERGFVLNGRKVILKGANLHQDHAGVGSGIPDALWRYRLMQLRKWGFNAIRSSHNPASPALLDLCDSLGFFVIDENREFGSSFRHLELMGDMIRRDRNHPCVILWSVGNEEWAVEHSPKGELIGRRLCELAHRLDPSRPCTYGSSSGRDPNYAVDVFGFNYIVQNPVEELHSRFPGKSAVGTEETSGAGTRGSYLTDAQSASMLPLNRTDTAGVVNCIARGWKFYKENSWTAGLFYWTGFDYRGESNPMVWPATGSQFGILDYCGFPKDEAYYLKSWWRRSEPCLHICGYARGEIWVYSNCSSVELYKNGKSLGSKDMPEDGYLSWKLSYREGDRISACGCYQPLSDASADAGGLKPGASAATGGLKPGASAGAGGLKPGAYAADGKPRIRNGRRIYLTEHWPSAPEGTSVEFSAAGLKPDGQDVLVLDIHSAEKELAVEAIGVEVLGWGNGDPGFKYLERPTATENIVLRPFNGWCQLLLRSVAGASGTAEVSIGARKYTVPYQP